MPICFGRFLFMLLLYIISSHVFVRRSASNVLFHCMHDLLATSWYNTINRVGWTIEVVNCVYAFAYTMYFACRHILESPKSNMCTNCCGNHLIWLVFTFFLLFVCLFYFASWNLESNRIESNLCLSIPSIQYQTMDSICRENKGGRSFQKQLNRAHVH